MATAKKPCLLLFFFLILIFTYQYSKSAFSQMTTNFELLLMNIIYEVGIPTQILLTILLLIDCSKMARIRTNIRICTKEKPYSKFVIYAKLVQQKFQKSELNMCKY